ncbi:MAG: MerR family DNA-binding protein [Acidobacteria bacterium]|nr:MerR family DNA-binding protein [Acidobacteriota bacterium]MCI0724854.1 MerR family DNA-binding protein [Acidobacteriota bacterium]
MAEELRIGEAARASGLSIDAIRFYGRIGLLRDSERTSGGYRLFDRQQLDRLAFISRAQALGFSLKQIRELVNLQHNAHACLSVRSLLEQKLAVVRAKMNELVALEVELRGALRRCNHELKQKRAAHGKICPVLREIQLRGKTP